MGPTRPWRSAAAQVFVDDLGDPVADDAAAHHLGRVLRLRAGEEVCAADGSGRWRRCTWDGGKLVADGPVEDGPRPSGPPVTIAFVPPKGDRPELIVQKLTELGVDRILVTSSARSVVRWDGERGERHIERLRRVARSAAEQCRRLSLPVVERTDLASVLGSGDVALADMEGRPPDAGDVGFVVGPEGGWTDAERELARSCGAASVCLAEHVLRAETAAIAAAVVATLSRVAG